MLLDLCSYLNNIQESKVRHSSKRAFRSCQIHRVNETVGLANWEVRKSWKECWLGWKEQEEGSVREVGCLVRWCSSSLRLSSKAISRKARSDMSPKWEDYHANMNNSWQPRIMTLSRFKAVLIIYSSSLLWKKKMWRIWRKVWKCMKPMICLLLHFTMKKKNHHLSRSKWQSGLNSYKKNEIPTLASY